MTTLINKKLEQYKSAGTEIDIYLKNGIRLNGKIVDYDEEAIVISSNKAGLDDGILITRGALATVQKTTTRDNKERR